MPKTPLSVFMKSLRFPLTGGPNEKHADACESDFWWRVMLLCETFRIWIWIWFVYSNGWKADREHILGLTRSGRWSLPEVGARFLSEKKSRWLVTTPFKMELPLVRGTQVSVKSGSQWQGWCMIEITYNGIQFVQRKRVSKCQRRAIVCCKVVFWNKNDNVQVPFALRGVERKLGMPMLRNSRSRLASMNK